MVARTVARASSPKTLVDLAAERLRRDIVAGDLAAGERVNLEGASAKLKMSPIPIREALRILAAEGLVVPLRHRGYTVSHVTVADLEETYRLRLLLEPVAVQLAVPRIKRETIQQLARDLDRLEVAFERSQWAAHRRYHSAFHFGIYSRCDSPKLLRFIELLWLTSERYQRISTRLKGELDQRANEHRLILRACERGEASRAGELMRHHLTRAFSTIRASLLTEPSAGTGNGRRALQI